MAKVLTPEQINLLKSPLPKEAISPHPTKSFLSTIKAIYVVERLNDVFGIGTWSIRGEKVVESTEKMVVIESKFEVPEYNITLWAFGGNDNSDRGDAYKGAVTDALTKIGSFLGIGMDVFKGLGDKKTDDRPYQKQDKSSTFVYNRKDILNEIQKADTINKLVTVHTKYKPKYDKKEIPQEEWDIISDNLTARKQEIEATK